MILDIYNEIIRTSTAVYCDEEVDLDDRRSWFAQLQAAGYPIVVGELDGIVRGFGSLGSFRDKAGYRSTVEHTVHVRGAGRGRGLGGALLQTLIERAQVMNKHMMIAGIDAENDRSIRFHERFAFERVGYLPEVARKFDRWLDLVFMQRRLDDGA